jgi:uncharacterized protein YjbI with pentapeptide repeats
MPRILKPSRLSTVHQVVELQRQSYLVVTTLGLFPFANARKLLPEASLWKLVAEELGTTPLDECLPKPRAEFLVGGHCFPPGGPAPASYVRARVGALDKTIAVIGDRSWRDGVPTQPQNFNSMPVIWERAFGGEGFAGNPLGRGHAGVAGVHALPNLEDPSRLVSSPSQHPSPVSFRPIDRGWPERMRKVGTYDERWLKELFPGFAADLDPTYFNAAPSDQQQSTAFAGGEPFSFEHMHPTKARVDGALPRFAARTFLQRVGAVTWEEVTMRLDTVWFFPHVERGILVFRGVVAIGEDDASDVDTMLLAAEDLDAPRDGRHYLAEAARRMDRDRGALRSLRDAPLLPKLDETASALPEDASPMKDLLQTEGIGQRRAKDRLGRELQTARERVALALQAQGIDPAEHMPPVAPAHEPLPSIDDEEAMFDRIDREEAAAEAARIDAEQKRAEMEASARSTCQELGLDYDVIKAEGQRAAAGPPKFRAKQEWERLRRLAEDLRAANAPSAELEAMLTDAKFYGVLVGQEEALVKMYRQGAHLAPAAQARTGSEAVELRQVVAELHAMKGHLGKDDWTGLDLSNLDLRGANFQGAFLESANLRGADLRGADLTDAVLAHADLRGAHLEGCQLIRANLGASRLEGAFLANAIASNSIFMRAKLANATLPAARLDGADFMEAQLEGADLSGAHVPHLTLYKTSLRGVRFVGAQLHKATLVDVDVSGADFTDADLSLASFVTVNADGCSFRRANMTKFHAVRDSSFRGSVFDAARLEGAFMRGSPMAKTSLREATLSDADLGGCDLREASFYRAHAVRAVFERADLSGADLTAMNLMEGSLGKARLFGAKLIGMNLFGADLAKIRVDTATVITECLMTHARIYPKAADATR